MTKITGLEVFYTQDDLNNLSTRFQKEFACSVSFHELPIKVGKDSPPLKEMMVHGNFVPELTEFFVNECKIERRYITSVNKLAK